MRPALVITLILALTSFPLPVGAQSLDELLKDQPELELVPKPEAEMCGEKKCFNLENYKLYLQMRVQYVWLFRVHTGLVPTITSELKNSAHAFGKAEKIQAERADRAEKRSNELLAKYVKAVQEAEQAKGHSLWGGGLPWLVTFTVVGLAGGFVLGGYVFGSK